MLNLSVVLSELSKYIDYMFALGSGLWRLYSYLFHFDWLILFDFLADRCKIWPALATSFSVSNALVINSTNVLVNLKAIAKQLGKNNVKTQSSDIDTLIAQLLLLINWIMLFNSKDNDIVQILTIYTFFQGKSKVFYIDF